MSVIASCFFIGPAWLPERFGSHSQGREMKMGEDITKTAGIDTGKERLALGFWPRGERLTVSNALEGFALVAEALRRQGVNRVGIESTATYHFAVSEYLRSEGVEVVVLQPGQVKAFAKLQNERVKRDGSDAELVAGTTSLIETVYPPQAAEMAALAEHLTYLEQLEDHRARLKTQLERFRDPDLIAKKKRAIADASLAIRQERQALAQKVDKYPHLKKRVKLATSVPGVGLRSALSVVIRMPELGRLGRGKAAALLGVAPLDDQSGNHEGLRFIQGGRARARSSLYMAAFSACTQHNPWLKRIYKRLMARGKAHTAAVIACTRKLVILLDAIFLRGTKWQDEWKKNTGGMPCPH
jgi:transposase